ncbi:MAG: cytochrome b N-terminal domain-containing protein, partial [Gammaproteobacteria bacterium]|nr:cytochrome b N-terminal domain-containing protein [Gammaproteobacteria bacterium]
CIAASCAVCIVTPTVRLAVAVTVHLIREGVLGRFIGARWFSWVTGVPLLWLLFASAIGGYWLVWDEKAAYIALVSARLFDSLPIVTEPMAFGFINDAAVSDRFFSLLIFLHIGFPLALLLGMFIHIKRINHARISPPKPLSMALLGSLIGLSIVLPARSLGPANLDAPLKTVEIDWFYMNIYPLIESLGPGIVWFGLLGLTGGLIAMPLLIREKHPQVAVVDPDFCNGCGWCFADCPYEAIYMKPHDYRENNEQAVVIADNCVGCGICAGACPSVTPFKSFDQAYSGIDLPEFKVTDLFQEVREELSRAQTPHKVLVVGCAHGVDLGAINDDDIVTLELECIGQLPPSYMDYLCRREGVEAVLLTGCRQDACYHRLGVDLQEEDVSSACAEPHLRYPDVKERVSRLWVGTGGEAELAASISQIRQTLDEDAESESREENHEHA